MTAAAPFFSKGEQKHHIRNTKLDGHKRQTWPNAFGSVTPPVYSPPPADTYPLPVLPLFLSYSQKRNVSLSLSLSLHTHTHTSVNLTLSSKTMNFIDFGSECLCWGSPMLSKTKERKTTHPSFAGGKTGVSNHFLTVLNQLWSVNRGSFV